jgi:hypothetical protein
MNSFYHRNHTLTSDLAIVWIPEYIKQSAEDSLKRRRTMADVWDYDHIDENRSHNDFNNCQALCPNCHAKKTRGLLKQKTKSNRMWIAIAITILLLIIIAKSYNFI